MLRQLQFVNYDKNQKFCLITFEYYSTNSTIAKAYEKARSNFTNNSPAYDGLQFR